MAKNKKYYLHFLIPEIPNILQIIGFPTLFGVLLNKPLLAILIPILVGFMLLSYLLVQSEKYLGNSASLDDDWRFNIYATGVLSLICTYIILLK